MLSTDFQLARIDPGTIVRVDSSRLGLVVRNPRTDFGPDTLQRVRAHEKADVAAQNEFLHDLVFGGSDKFLWLCSRCPSTAARVTIG